MNWKKTHGFSSSPIKIENRQYIKIFARKIVKIANKFLFSPIKL